MSKAKKEMNCLNVYPIASMGLVYLPTFAEYTSVQMEKYFTNL